MRKIVLDTETTGLDYKNGDRIVEIGCVEIVNNKMTGSVYHTYINPCKPLSSASKRIIGIDDNFLLNKPLFENIVDNFLDFIKNDPIIAHNATFDINFLNMELGLVKKLSLTNEVIDTLSIARKKFKGKKCTLDALCSYLSIDNSNRTFHGALLDAQLLGKVYIGLNVLKEEIINSSALFDSQHEKKDSDLLNNDLDRDLITTSIFMKKEQELHKIIMDSLKV